jgi:hypothetical protein
MTMKARRVEVSDERRDVSVSDDHESEKGRSERVIEEEGWK